MEKITLQGKKVVAGKAVGEAIICHEPISFIGGVDPNTGYVIEKGHELEGRKITGKILIYPTGKGSTGGSYRLYEMVYQKTAPAAIILIDREPVVTVGCIMGNIPMVDGLEKNPLEVIKDGDLVEVDADNGTVIIKRKK